MELVITTALLVVGFLGKDYVVRQERKELLDRIQAPEKVVERIAVPTDERPQSDLYEPLESNDAVIYQFPTIDELRAHLPDEVS